MEVVNPSVMVSRLDLVVLASAAARLDFLSRIIGEAPMEVVNPSVMVSRLDLVVLDSAAAGIDFRRLP